MLTANRILLAVLFAVSLAVTRKNRQHWPIAAGVGFDVLVSFLRVGVLIPYLLAQHSPYRGVARWALFGSQFLELMQFVVIVWVTWRVFGKKGSLRWTLPLMLIAQTLLMVGYWNSPGQGIYVLGSFQFRSRYVYLAMSLVSNALCWIAIVGGMQEHLSKIERSSDVAAIVTIVSLATGESLAMAVPYVRSWSWVVVPAIFIAVFAVSIGSHVPALFGALDKRFSATLKSRFDGLTRRVALERMHGRLENSERAIAARIPHESEPLDETALANALPAASAMFVGREKELTRLAAASTTRTRAIERLAAIFGAVSPDVAQSVLEDCLDVVARASDSDATSLSREQWVSELGTRRNLMMRPHAPFTLVAVAKLQGLDPRGAGDVLRMIASALPERSAGAVEESERSVPVNR